MRGFATSPNPYMSGLRPKSFFAARVEMLRQEKMHKTINKSSKVQEDTEKEEHVKKAA